MSQWAQAVIPLALALIAGGIAFGALRYQVRSEHDRITELEHSVERLSTVVERLADKVSQANGRRLEDLRDEVRRLRDWRHAVENDWLGRRLFRKDET